MAVRRVPLVLHVLWQLPAERHRFLQHSARRNAPGDLSADTLGSNIAKRMFGTALLILLAVAMRRRLVSSAFQFAAVALRCNCWSLPFATG